MFKREIEKKYKGIFKKRLLSFINYYAGIDHQKWLKLVNLYRKLYGTNYTLGIFL